MPRIQKAIQRDFTAIHNGFLKDSKLSLAGRGLLVTMMSKPEVTSDDTPWNFTIRGLASELKEGKAAISKALEELEERGCLMRDLITDKKGRFVDVLYTFSDEVMPEAIEKYRKKHPEKYAEPVESVEKSDLPYPENPDNNKIKKNKILKKILSEKSSINKSAETAEKPVETVESPERKKIDGRLSHTAGSLHESRERKHRLRWLCLLDTKLWCRKFNVR